MKYCYVTLCDLVNDCQDVQYWKEQALYWKEKYNELLDGYEEEKESEINNELLEKLCERLEVFIERRK